MNLRCNCGYIITDSIHIGDTEFVLGVNSNAPSNFVTWSCKNGTDYYWGTLFFRSSFCAKGLVQPCGTGSGIFGNRENGARNIGIR